MIELSDRDILSRLTDTEDSTVERKTAADYRDCLKTAVGFSNSLPVGDPGIIFVGVGNDGTVQDRLNLESLQKDVSKELCKIYPPIYAQMKVMRDQNVKEFLAVIVRGSDSRPHFAGPSYIRDGTQTREASDEQFLRLIAERNNRAREILKWLEKDISVRLPPGEKVLVGNMIYFGNVPGRVVACNQFYVSIEYSNNGGAEIVAYPLRFVEIGYDHENERPRLICQPH
jgi:Schlafen, AlbA_2